MADKTLDDLWAAIDDLQAGLFRAPVGPGGIRAKMIKPKSVYANTIDVSDLQSVNQKTGNLSVTGSIAMTTAGDIHAGQTAYDTGVGWWLEYNAGTPRLSLGNSGGNKLTWNGTTLAITGSVTATTGTIGGWTIGSTDLTGSGGVIGLASSGSIRIWSGNAVPASAPFQVDSLGNLTATAGSIGGWAIDSTSGLKLGTTTSTRGISTGSVAFYAGSATPSSAPFNVTTAGALTATSGTIGGLTLSSSSLSGTNWSVTSAGVMTSTSGTVGGLTINANDITIPTGKALKWASGNSSLTDTKWSIQTTGWGQAIEFKDSVNTAQGSIWANTTQIEYAGQFSGGATQRGLDFFASGTQRTQLFDVSAGIDIIAGGGNGVSLKGAVSAPRGQIDVGNAGNVLVTLGDAAGTYSFKVNDSAAQTQFGITSNGQFVFPDADGTALGAYQGRIPIFVNGTLRYLGYYA